MAIPEKDAKILWGRAAGRCSNPTCDIDLTAELESGGHYNIGEMAHVIAQSKSGPRGDGIGGDDTYDNLILLCPTCHRRIDKAPKNFPEDMLIKWKSQHELKIKRAGREIKVNDFKALCKHIRPLLIENNVVHTQLGPCSPAAQEDPGSNLYKLWNLQKLSTIIPNNKKIINIIEANLDLISEYIELFMKFKIHAEAFEKHQYNKLDNYPLFPKKFSEVFTNE